MKSRYLSLLLLCLTPFAFLWGQTTEDFSIRVDITSIRESGFMKLLEAKFPQAKMMFDMAEEDDDFQEFTKLTGIKLEDIESLEILASGIDKVIAAQSQGREPKMGSEVGFVVVAKTNSKVNFDAVMKLMMESLEEEEGPEVRKKVEATRKSKDGTTYLTIPKELMDDPSFDSDILLSMTAGAKGSTIAMGVPSQVRALSKKGRKGNSFACLAALAKDRQVTFAMNVPPSVWTQPGMNFDQQNPLMAGLANAVKGIREVGLSLSFREKSLGVEICLNCADAQSALGLWTVAQGGLGMAQLAAAQEGAQVPAILNRIKTQALEKNVLVKVVVIPSDLDQFGGMFPASSNGLQEDPEIEE
jgi:hypothetical protein